MIIKSMSRKERSFSQLLDYMESGRADERFTIHHNLYGRSPEEVKEEFIQNSQFLHHRTGANYMYHEVISISRSDQVKLDEQKEKLRQIAQDYIRDRARHNLAYGALHDDHDNNIHFHLIISANEVASQNRFRLSKREFDQIKKSLERKVLKHYPELQQKELINRSSKEHLSNKGAELKRRTGRTPQRDAVREKVRTIFKHASSREQLLDGFDKADLDFYMRGKHPGVIDRETGRKHRIKSLGFIEQFKEIDRKIEVDLKRGAKQDKPASSAKPKKRKPEQSTKPKQSDRTESQKRTRDQSDTHSKGGVGSSEKRSRAKEAFREWVMGDFSAREARAKQAEYERIRDLMRETHPELNTKAKLDEWHKGDFSERELHQKAERIKSYYRKLDEEKSKEQRKAEEETLDQKFSHQEKVDQQRREQMKQRRAQSKQSTEEKKNGHSR